MMSLKEHTTTAQFKKDDKNGKDNYNSSNDRGMAY